MSLYFANGHNRDLSRYLGKAPILQVDTIFGISKAKLTCKPNSVPPG